VLEREVMDVLWERETSSSTIREVADQLPDYAYTTIATVLSRLAEKDLVVVVRQDRVLRYAAAEARAVRTTILMQEALSATPDPGAALARFVDSASAEQVAVLRRALKRRARVIAPRGDAARS
jgi:predicted transcriptional regulator